MSKIKFEETNINKELAYFLGFLWADGHISNNKHYKIYLSIKENDGESIKNYIKSIGDITIRYKNMERYGYSNQILFYLGDKNFHNFLEKNDYLHKSKVSPDKILSILNENIKKYFMLGLVDGDGCFYYNKKNYLRQFSITSNYDQNWNYMINLSKKLGIEKYNIIKRNNKENQRCSLYRVCNKKDIKKIYDYIYFDKNFIPLKRKYNKCQEILGI